MRLRTGSACGAVQECRRAPYWNVGRGLKAFSGQTVPQMVGEEFQHQTNAVIANSTQIWNSLWWLKSTFLTKETWTRLICEERYPLPVYDLLAQNIRLVS